MDDDGDEHGKEDETYRFNEPFLWSTNVGIYNWDPFGLLFVVDLIIGLLAR